MQIITLPEVTGSHRKPPEIAGKCGFDGILQLQCISLVLSPRSVFSMNHLLSLTVLFILLKLHFNNILKVCNLLSCD